MTYRLYPSLPLWRSPCARPLLILGLSACFLVGSASIAQMAPYDSELIEARYREQVEARRVKDTESFRDPETTLLCDEYFERFTGVEYFPVDLAYRIVGKLTRLSESKSVELEMTGGTPYGFMHYGKISFHLDGEPIELQVFEYPSHPNSGSTAIFVPYKDLTTGAESFGGGRFLIIKIPKDDRIVLDFNLSINPICVYDPDHSCPVSPRSNRIAQRVEAGIKMYHDPGL